MSTSTFVDQAVTSVTSTGTVVLPAATETLVGSFTMTGMEVAAFSVHNVGANPLTGLRLADSVSPTGTAVTTLTNADFATPSNYLILGTAAISTLAAGASGIFKVAANGVVGRFDLYATSTAGTSVSVDVTTFTHTQA